MSRYHLSLNEDSKEQADFWQCNKQTTEGSRQMFGDIRKQPRNKQTQQTDSPLETEESKRTFVGGEVPHASLASSPPPADEPDICHHFNFNPPR